MANLRAIRTRIKSVENTRQITKSMKMVAAAKLRKTQAAFGSLRTYSDECGKLLSEAAAGQPTADNPYLTTHQACQKVCYVLIVGNRGLCGTYNQGLLRYFENLIREDDREKYIIVCGRWGKDLIAAAGIRAQENLELSDTPTHEEALLLAEKLKQIYREGSADEIVLVYQHYRSVLSQVPTQSTLLPLNREEHAASEVRTIFEPDRDSILNI